MTCVCCRRRTTASTSGSWDGGEGCERSPAWSTSVWHPLGRADYPLSSLGGSSYTPRTCRVDQVIPRLARRDAVGLHTINLRDGLRADGIDSDIYYGSFEAEVQHEGRMITALGRGGRRRWLLYQASIGSSTYEFFASRREPKIVNYHNITPAHLLDHWDPEVGFAARLGRAQLAGLAEQSRLSVADSVFNESELIEMGFLKTAVVPLLIDAHRKSGQPDPALMASMIRRRETLGGADLLFVGKVSPHKAPHDLVKMLSVLREGWDPKARLHLVGSALGATYEPAFAPSSANWDWTGRCSWPVR